MDQKDIDAIADALATKMINSHEWYLDPEKHYNAHKKWEAFDKKIDGEEVYDLKNLVRIYRMTKSLWLKAFVGAAIVGTVVLVAVGMGVHK